MQHRKRTLNKLSEAGAGIDGSPHSRALIGSPALLGGDWFAKRHLAGVYNLACDEEATVHYDGAPGQGIRYRLWQVRLYLRGFFKGR